VESYSWDRNTTDKNNVMRMSHTTMIMDKQNHLYGTLSNIIQDKNGQNHDGVEELVEE
jgi:hypothetical protein